MTSQPSEIHVIFNDALTDLKALVDHLLPVASDEAGGFAGRMMAAIEQVGATATAKVNSSTTNSSESSPTASCKTGVASPQCSASEQSNLQCCETSALQLCASEYSSDDNEVMDDSTYGSSSAGLTPVASVPRVVVEFLESKYVQVKVLNTLGCYHSFGELIQNLAVSIEL